MFKNVQRGIVLFKGKGGRLEILRFKGESLV